MFHRQKASEKAFRKIGFGAIFISVILLIVAMYFAVSRATIIVEPEEEVMNAELIVSIKEAGIQEGDIAGRITKTTLKKEAVFAPSGETREEPGQAEGEIEIINKHTSGQTLIPTTRFLSEDGVLFRLKDKVSVPAGGSIVAEIYADKKGAEGNIEPTTFTIPGLAKSLQTKIYGVSKEPMTGGIRKISVISEDDIENAVEGMRTNLLLEGSEQIKAELQGDSQYNYFVFKDNVISQEVDKEPGEESDEFNVKLEAEIIGVAYGDALIEQAQKTIDDMVPSDRNLISSNISELAPTIQNYNLDSRTATLKIELIGNTVVNESSFIFEREMLFGKTEGEVREHLEKRMAIKNLEIKFFPFWITKVPMMKDHIKIIVR